MTKTIRKYRSWFMSAFMILLMLAWLGAPASRGMGEIRRSRTVGRLDGVKISADDQLTASKEISAIHSILPGVFGIEDRDATHWMLLSREAQNGGYVGETADGEDFLPALAREMIQGDFRLQMQLQQQGVKTFQEAEAMVGVMIKNKFGGNQMTTEERDLALAKLRGVDRMLRAYRTATRLSDRETVALAKKEQDAAVTDMVVLPSSLIADQIPDPDDATLAAHFDKFKGTKPGEGEFGIGYLLPRRVKMEWMTLNREVFEKAVVLDPIEVRKRHAQNVGIKYSGDFAAERANVEKDMRSDAADKAMQDAQLVVQAEVLKATRLLENDGATKYKKLPPDWDQRKPKFEAIAQAVVDELKKNGLNIPLPEVTVKGAKWLTESDLIQLSGIGAGYLRQGGAFKSFKDVVGWTRELPGSEPGLLPIQVGVPVGENFLSDGQKNRYYIEITATRGEGAPDTVEDVKELAIKDYKGLRAFEQLQGRLAEFRAAAVSGGLDAVVALATPPTPMISDPAKKDEKKPTVRKGVRVTRTAIPDGQVNEEAIRAAVVDAAAAFDPMAPYGTLDAEKATLALAAPKHLCVGAFRVQAYAPLTREAYRQADATVVSQEQRAEQSAKPGTPEDPFSLGALLKRHDYMNGDEHIRTVDQLKKRDTKTEG